MVPIYSYGASFNIGKFYLAHYEVFIGDFTNEIAFVIMGLLVEIALSSKRMPPKVLCIHARLLQNSLLATCVLFTLVLKVYRYVAPLLMTEQQIRENIDLIVELYSSMRRLYEIKLAFGAMEMAKYVLPSIIMPLTIALVLLIISDIE